MILEKLREELIDAGKELIKSGLVVSTQGNISARDPENNLMVITPSGMDYESLTPEDIIVTDLDCNIKDGKRKPSSELPVHAYILRNKPNINAVVHTHSPYATALSIVNIEIPPVLAQLAEAVGGNVPIAPFVIGGSEKLGEAAIKKMGDKNAVLLKNHGVVAVGKDLKSAMFVALMVEDTARIYHIGKTVGEPDLIPEEASRIIREWFVEHYGQDDSSKQEK